MANVFKIYIFRNLVNIYYLMIYIAYRLYYTTIYGNIDIAYKNVQC